MSALANSLPMPRDENYYRLLGVVEDFLFEEAEFLDTRNYVAWLETLSDNLT